MYTILVTGLFAALLSACTAAPLSQEISCDDSQTLCYRGNSIDSQATRDRYGVRGLIRLNNEYSDRSSR